jgi:hypothetical protein
MTNFTEARIRFLLNIIPDFEEFVEKRIDAYEDLNDRGSGYASDIEYDTGFISYTWSIRRCGCCPPDYESGKMPAKYLWEEKWLEKAIEEKKRRKEAEERKAIANLEKARIAKEKREREKYEQLKEKFGDTTH